MSKRAKGKENRKAPGVAPENGNRRERLISRQRKELSEEFNIVASPNFLDLLINESDRGCVLIAADLIDNLLGKLLGEKFIYESKIQHQDLKILLEGEMAPLRSMSHRANFAYALGLIDGRVWRSIDLLRQMRNTFAHSGKPLSLSSRGVQRLHATIEAMTPEREYHAFMSSLVIFDQAAKRKLNIGDERTKFFGLFQVMANDLRTAIESIGNPKNP